MTPSKCPVCGCQTFHVKNPDDPYDIYEFQCREGEVHFQPDVDAQEAPPIHEATETFCNACAWHGRFQTIR